MYQQVIIFTHIPKTAGTSFKTLLRANYGIHCVEANKVKRPLFTDQDLRFASKVFFGIRAVVGHNLANPTEHLSREGMVFVTFLRQPLDRCLSHYQDRVVRTGLKMNFEQWIGMEENQNIMVRFIAGSPNLARAKRVLKEQFQFVGFTERFEESLKMLNALLERPLELGYNFKIRSASNQIREQILEDEKCLELARRHNRLDQQLYDYALSEIFLPRLSQLATEIDRTRVQSDKFTWKQRLNHTSAVKYNKMIYRPLVKILKK
jgi:hypothetical protein